MKLFIDSADIDEIKSVIDYGILDGVTTNPSLIKIASRKYKIKEMETYIKNILKVTGKLPVSLEVLGDNYNDLVREGLILQKKFHKHGNIYVKIPVNPCFNLSCSTEMEGIKAIKKLTGKGIKINCTLIFTPEQALLAAKAGAKYVSPFAGRIDDMLRIKAGMKFNKKDYFPKGGISKGKKTLSDQGIKSGVDLIEQTRLLFDKQKIKAKILAASIRNPRQFREVGEAGSDIATLPYPVIKQLIEHKKTAEGMKKFSKDIVPEYAKIVDHKTHINENKTNIISLDEAVLNALHLFQKRKLPEPNITFKRPLVVGSGNAAATGIVIFEDRDAIFADEGTYKKKLKSIKDFDGAVLISASGTKHAPIIAKDLKKRKLKTILFTNNNNAPANKYVSKTYVFPKNEEPYTYNTSTYMGIILGKTKENPRIIEKFINNQIKPKIPKNFDKYDSFFIILPTEFENMSEFFLTKFDELFGSKISGRVFTPEQTKHAKTVIKNDKELFISLGYKNKSFGKNRLNLPIPINTNYGALLAIGYYVIGQIQNQNPQYFKNSIKLYTEEASKLFHSKIKDIVK